MRMSDLAAATQILRQIRGPSKDMISLQDSTGIWIMARYDWPIKLHITEQFAKP